RDVLPRQSAPSRMMRPKSLATTREPLSCHPCAATTNPHDPGDDKVSDGDRRVTASAPHLAAFPATSWRHRRRDQRHTLRRTLLSSHDTFLLSHYERLFGGAEHRDKLTDPHLNRIHLDFFGTDAQKVLAVLAEKMCEDRGIDHIGCDDPPLHQLVELRLRDAGAPGKLGDTHTRRRDMMNERFPETVLRDQVDTSSK